jgi:hypothetical protein
MCDADAYATGGEAAVECFVGNDHCVVQENVRNTSSGMESQVHGNAGVDVHAGFTFPYQVPAP